MTVILIIQGVFFGLMGAFSILGPMSTFNTAGPELMSLLRLVGFTYLFMMMFVLLTIRNRTDQSAHRFGFTGLIFFNGAFAVAHGVNALSFGTPFFPAIVHGVLLILLLFNQSRYV